MLTLPTCVVPGCTNLVPNPDYPCDDCRIAFGGMLREAHKPPPSAEVVDAQNTRYREVMAERALMVKLEARQKRKSAIDKGEQRKPGQVCWLCEERRSCLLVNGRWECDGCR